MWPTGERRKATEAAAEAEGEAIEALEEEALEVVRSHCLEQSSGALRAAVEAAAGSAVVADILLTFGLVS